MTSNPRRLAIVTPWFGRELIGGAERLAWDLSSALARRGNRVEVLTTCSRSFHDDWSANYHRPGSTLLANLLLRRFRVDPRDRVAFSRANSALLALRRDQLHRDRPPLPAEKTRAFLTQGIHSRDLVAHLRRHGADYDAVVFLPYLYGTTLDGLPAVADKAFLLPCLHDEAYAYLDEVRDLFRQARGLLFNSGGELEVAASLYGPWIHASASIIGHAVDVTEPPAAPVSFKGFTPHCSRYVLYLGRGDRTKNLGLALEAFAAFRRSRKATALQFVIAGPHAQRVRSGEGVVDLGAVTEEVKSTLLAHARALVQPSTNESFSRTIYEAWHARRPVVVHADCWATASAVEESGGGWTARTLEDWAAVFTTIDESSDALVNGLGNRGRAAAIEAGDWNDVAARLLVAIEPFETSSAPVLEQFVPLGSGPATRHASALDAALRGAGYVSSINIEGTAPRAEAKVIRHVGEDGTSEPSDAVIVHVASAGLPPNSLVFAATPAVGAELSARGIANCLLPAPVDPGRWREHATDARPADGTNVLSCSPLDAADAEGLLHVFALLRRHVRDARLLVLEETCRDFAREALLELASSLGLGTSIQLVGTSESARYGAFRAARVACALGCTAHDDDALVDALWFDLPIVAYETATADFVEQCGIVADRDDPGETAALLALVLSDADLRLKLVQEGRRARSRRAPTTLTTALINGLQVRPARSTPLNRNV